MSLCFRALPGRLSSLVSGQKPLSKLVRHQPRKHIESSALLKQFLAAQRALSVKANATSKASMQPAVYALHQNLSLASLNACSQWNEKPVGQHDDGEESKSATYWAQTRKSQRSQRLSVVVAAKSRKHVAPIGITSSDVTMFQAQNVVGSDENNSFLDNSRIIASVSEGTSRNSQNSSIERGILLTDNMTTLKTNQQQSPPPAQDNEGKPSQEQLQCVLDWLSQDLPKLFVKPQSYHIYTKDLIFINNIRGVTTRGLLSYAKQLALLKLFGHIKFAHVKFDIIKITMHTEDATVKIRWRIRGVSGIKMFSVFWKYKIWKIQDAIDRYHEVWYDGFSTFYVNSEGKIYKHIADKVMPDQDVAEKKEDLRIAPKLALFTGLADMLDSDDENSFSL